MIENPVKVTKDSKITLVELPASGGTLDGETPRDVYSRLRLPPRAIPLLHGILIKQGYKDVVSIAPQYNPGSKLTTDDWRRIHGTDVFLISTITRTARESEQLAREFKEDHPRSWVGVGGVYATGMPEECSEWADVVFRGEGDETLPELMLALENNNSPKGVKGLSYKVGDRVVHEQDRNPISVEAFAKLPAPVYSKAVQEGIRIYTAVTSRGCPNGCTYCGVPMVYGPRYRRKPNEVNIKELKALPQGRPVFVLDDNIGGIPEETKDLLRLMAEEGLNRNSYYGQARAQVGLIKGLPELLWPAGVRMLAIGYESVSDSVLASVEKRETVAQMREGTRRLKEGSQGLLRIHGMFMIGLDGETPATAEDILKFAMEECDTAQFFAPGPVWGTEFARNMVDQDRVLTRDFSYYDGQYVVVRPENFTPYELKQTIDRMYNQFYSTKLLMNRAKRTIFGGTSAPIQSRFSQTWRQLKYDAAIRLYAWQAISAHNNSVRTREYSEKLKSWS